jgi:hypothetical protein
MALPQAFVDSTHQLWRLEGARGMRVLKVCRRANLHHSSFWQAMQALFGLQLPEQLHEYSVVYSQLAQWSPLEIPFLHACERENPPFAGFLLADCIAGESVQAGLVTLDMVKQLAQHLGCLHQQVASQFGGLAKPNFAGEHWVTRLRCTLQVLVGGSPCAHEQAWWQTLQTELLLCVEHEFVPVMMDLRWDQFLQQNAQLTGLVDLDAMVWAPCRLEWVLLEYLLTEEQAQVFAKEYSQRHALPNLQVVRRVYRFLLFKMHVLGEQDLQKWMQHPVRF